MLIRRLSLLALLLALLPFGLPSAQGDGADVVQEQAAAQMLDPQLYKVLEGSWAGSGGAGKPCAPGNFTVISVPSGLNVFVAAQSEIPGALNDDGEPASVEDVVFRPEKLRGVTPLTFMLPAGDYVLALRPQGRERGFDGGCVRKAERDVITGALRHTYHLYPLTRSAGEYQLFVASFVTPETSDPEMLRDLAAPWTFHLPDEQLVGALGQVSSAPADLHGRIAADLNRYGLAFFSDGAHDWLVKLSLRGASFELNEWPVRY